MNFFATVRVQRTCWPSCHAEDPWFSAALRRDDHLASAFLGPFLHCARIQRQTPFLGDMSVFDTPQMDPNVSWVFFPTPQVLIFHSPGSLCFHWAVARDDVSHETSLLHAVMILHTWILQSQWCHWFGYGSIPINTIFRGMNIHLPAILMFTRGTRFWHTAIWQVMECILKWLLWSNLEKTVTIKKFWRQPKKWQW